MLPGPGLLCRAPQPLGTAAESRVTPTALPGASQLAQPQPVPAPMGSTVTLVLLPGHLQSSAVPVLAAIQHQA